MADRGSTGGGGAVLVAGTGIAATGIAAAGIFTTGMVADIRVERGRSIFSMPFVGRAQAANLSLSSDDGQTPLETSRNLPDHGYGCAAGFCEYRNCSFVRQSRLDFPMTKPHSPRWQ